MANNGNADKGDYSAEIIALLKDVGDRLLRNEQERITLRDTLEDLENRFDQNENVFLSVHDRLSKTETAFSKRQDAIEAIQIEQSSRIEKAAAMADRIEEAMAQHASIHSRLEQEAQDKILILRQLEKIEDTVIETQAALRETALVPVGRYQKSGLPLGMRAQSQSGSSFIASFLSSVAAPFRARGMMRVTGVAGVIALGALGGWALHSVSGEADGLAGISIPGQSAHERGLQGAQNMARTHGVESSTIENAHGSMGHSRIAARDYGHDYDNNYDNDHDNGYGAVDGSGADVMDMSDEQLIAAWDADPDALAAQLNRIEPVSGHVMPENLDDIGQAHLSQRDDSHKAAFIQPDNQARLSDLVAAVDMQDFIATQRASGALRDRIKPDTALPAIIKEVEMQAYNGSAEAQHDLAAIYTAGHGGVPVDFERAAQWFRESAINGVANARYNLGVLYHQGLGVDQDIAMAVNWYRAAAQKGHPEAQYNLGIAYIEGIGTEYAPDYAAYYFGQAAMGGVLEAAYNLGLIHENGLVGEVRPDEAIFWYKYAADLGSAEAQEALRQITAVLGYQPGDIDRIYNAYAKSLKSGQPDNRTQRGGEQHNKNAAIDRGSAGEGAQIITAGDLKADDIAFLAKGGEAKKAGDGDDYAPNFAANHVSSHVPNHVSGRAPNLAAQHNDREFRSKVAAVDAATVAQLQEQLIKLGLYPGPSDGVYNSITEDAIRAYQAEFALTPDGRPTQALLVHMMTNNYDNREYGSREE